MNQAYSFPNQSFLPSQVEAALDSVVLEMQQLGSAAAMTVTGVANWPVVGSFGFVDPTGVQASDVGFAAAIASGAAFAIPPGTYKLTSGKTFTQAVWVIPGALLSLTTGQTYTFSGPLVAEVGSLFLNALSGGATVSISGEFTSEGYPEWWGAVANTSGADCAAPAMAAVRSGLKRVSFGAADYWFSSTFIIDAPYVEVFGVGMWWGLNGTGACTRLLANFATGPCVRLGTASAPGGGVNYYQRNNWLHHLNIARGVGFTAPAIGSEASGPTGLLVQYCSDFWIDHVRCDNHSVGFNLTSNVAGYLYRCLGFQSASATTITTNPSFTGAIAANVLTATGVTGTLGAGCKPAGAGVTSGTVIISQIGGTPGGAGTYALNLPSTVSAEAMTAPYDPFWGWFINGQNGIGPSNGNASVYIQNCGASMGGAPTVWGIGMQFTEALEDTFIRDFETSQTTIGINIVGQQGLSVGNLNVEIDHAVIDQFGLYGITIGNAATASINVVNSYCAPASGVAPSACYVVAACSGAITVSNNEADCVGNTVGGGGSCIGFYYLNSNGITSAANRAVDCQRPEIVTGCTGSSFMDTLANENNAASGFALSVSGTNKYLYLKPNVRGKANAFTAGINLASTTTTLSECNMTTVDSGCLSVAGAKLVYNAGNIVATGAFGTNNLASGVIA